jgi:hypothetical protein
VNGDEYEPAMEVRAVHRERALVEDGSRRRAASALTRPSSRAKIAARREPPDLNAPRTADLLTRPNLAGLLSRAGARPALEDGRDFGGCAVHLGWWYDPL